MTYPGTSSALPLRGAAGLLRRAATWISTPLLPEDFLGVVDPLWSARQLRGRVEAVLPESRGAATIVLRPGRGWQQHRAGQYLRVGVEIEGARQWRTYSLTSPESRADGLVSFTVKDVGLVSGQLVHRTSPGDLLFLEVPQGEFLLPEVPGPMLFLTGGSGITPVMGMLRTLAATGALNDVVMIHSATDEGDVCFAAELRALALAHPGFDLRIRLTDTEGLLSLTELAVLVPDWATRGAWVCGPGGLLDAAEAHYAAADRLELLHIERFRAALLGAVGEGGAVSYRRSGQLVEVDGTTSLLDAGEAAGVIMPSGCRMGICFGCVLPLRAGKVRDLRTGEVHGDEGDLVQTCISAAAGPVEIDV